MLVLTRKIGESIIIDDNITVRILDVRKKQIRIGIEAPESILIFREEIYKKILAGRHNKTDMDPAVKPRDDMLLPRDDTPHGLAGKQSKTNMDPEGLARDDMLLPRDDNQEEQNKESA